MHSSNCRRRTRVVDVEELAERKLGDDFGITGYPTFFLVPPGPGNPQRVSGMTRDGDGWRQRTPDDFVAECRRAAG